VCVCVCVCVCVSVTPVKCKKADRSGPETDWNYLFRPHSLKSVAHNVSKNQWDTRQFIIDFSF
jgi:hypothetical protein